MRLGPAGAERIVIAVSISIGTRSEAHKEGQIVGLSILCTTKRRDTPYEEEKAMGGGRRREADRVRETE